MAVDVGEVVEVVTNNSLEVEVETQDPRTEILKSVIQDSHAAELLAYATSQTKAPHLTPEVRQQILDYLKDNPDVKYDKAVVDLNVSTGAAVAQYDLLIDRLAVKYYATQKASGMTPETRLATTAAHLISTKELDPHSKEAQQLRMSALKLGNLYAQDISNKTVEKRSARFSETVATPTFNDIRPPDSKKTA
jgi:hypothetical protein